MSEGNDQYWNLNDITCAFCVGDRDRIVDAFLGHYKRAFRVGDVADRFLEMPVNPVDVVPHLPNAVADVLRMPRLPEVESERIAGSPEEGMWVEVMSRPWIEMFAATRPDHLADILARWARFAQDGYDPDPAKWASVTLAMALAQLMELASLSRSSGKPLLGLMAV